MGNVAIGEINAMGKGLQRGAVTKGLAQERGATREGKKIAHLYLKNLGLQMKASLRNIQEEIAVSSWSQSALK